LAPVSGTGIVTLLFHWRGKDADVGQALSAYIPWMAIQVPVGCFSPAIIRRQLPVIHCLTGALKCVLGGGFQLELMEYHETMPEVPVDRKL